MANGIGDRWTGGGWGRFAALGGLILALCAPALQAGAEAKVRFSATVDRHEIGLDETVTLTVTLTVAGGAAKDLVLPPTPDFQVRSRQQSDHTSFQFGTGGSGRQRVRTYVLQLQPLREGDLRIEAGSVVVRGVRYETDPIVIRVRGGGADDPVVAVAPPRGARGDVFVLAQVDKDRAYVGEQILLSIHLLARVDVRNVGSLQLPKLDGFWIGDIASPTQLSARMQTVDGVPYRSYLLSKKALFPLREGTLEIAPATVEVTTGGFPVGRPQTHLRRSEPLVVEVAPLPPGRPAGAEFGGVGDFTLALEAQPTRAKVGDPIHVRIAAEGVGNLGALQLPTLPAVDGLRAFDPTTSEETNLSSGRFGGRKTAEVLLVPEREGTYTLPPLEWVTFHPEEERYVVSRTEPLRLVVEGGGAVAATPPDVDPADGLATPPPSVRDAAGWKAPRPLAERGWFAVALALPALVALGMLGGPRLLGRWRESEGRRAQAARREAFRALGRLEGAPAQEAAAAAHRILHGYLEARLGAPTQGLPRDELLRRLEAAGVSSEARSELRDLLDAWERSRYAPELSDAEEVGFAAGARAWIVRVEEDGWGRRP